jgi:hypothetical protein
MMKITMKIRTNPNLRHYGYLFPRNLSSISKYKSLNRYVIDKDNIIAYAKRPWGDYYPLYDRSNTIDYRDIKMPNIDDIKDIFTKMKYKYV